METFALAVDTMFPELSKWSAQAKVSLRGMVGLSTLLPAACDYLAGMRQRVKRGALRSRWTLKCCCFR